MEYRTLGRTGLKVSSIGIGTWQLSGTLVLDGKADGFSDIGKDEAVRLIKECGDLGINFIDSAEIYGDGEGERRIGEATYGNRDNWVICTKFGMRKGVNGQRFYDVNSVGIRRSLENSLRRLQTDFVDVYLYHAPPKDGAISECHETLENLKKEGKIRFYGISTNDPVLLKSMVQQEAVEAVLFSQSLVTHPTRILEIVREHNLGGIVRGALESGRLSGRYFNEIPNLPKEDIRGYIFSRNEWRKYSIYKKILPLNMSMINFAIRYLLDYETTSTIALGGRTIKQYQEASKALSLSALDSQIHKSIERCRGRLLSKRLDQKVLRLGQPFINMLLRLAGS